MSGSAGNKLHFCFASLSCAVCEWCVACVEFSSFFSDVWGRVDDAAATLCTGELLFSKKILLSYSKKNWQNIQKNYKMDTWLKIYKIL